MVHRDGLSAQWDPDRIKPVTGPAGANTSEPHNLELEMLGDVGLGRRQANLPG
jgi:hypothetical protein